jgi:tetratricopeptide (TPR) repeat protein
MEIGEHERAHDLFSDSLALHRSVGDRQGIASTLSNLAEAASSLGNSETALGLFRESHSLALEGGNQLYAAIAMENLATLTRQRGEEGVAQTRYREALLLYRAVGDQQGIASSLSGMAFAASGLGRLLDATVLLGAASRVRDEHDELALPGLVETAEALRTALGAERFDAAWQSGRAMSIVDVIEYIAEQSGSAKVRLST